MQSFIGLALMDSEIIRGVSLKTPKINGKTKPGRNWVKVAVRACYRAYFIVHVFKYLSADFVSGRPA